MSKVYKALEMVDKGNGDYWPEKGAELLSWKRVKKTAKKVVLYEALTGYGKWEDAYLVTGQDNNDRIYFVGKI